MSVIEVHHKIRYGNFEDKLLGVVFIAISLLLDEILELSPIPVAVKDLFHFPLLFSINEYR